MVKPKGRPGGSGFCTGAAIWGGPALTHETER